MGETDRTKDLGKARVSLKSHRPRGEECIEEITVAIEPGVLERREGGVEVPESGMGNRNPEVGHIPLGRSDLQLLESIPALFGRALPAKVSPRGQIPRGLSPAIGTRGRL